MSEGGERLYFLLIKISAKGPEIFKGKRDVGRLTTHHHSAGRPQDGEIGPGLEMSGRAYPLKFHQILIPYLEWGTVTHEFLSLGVT